MQILLLITGIIFGAIASWIICTLSFKGKSIPQNQYDALNIKLNETNTKLQVSEQKISTQHTELLNTSNKLEAKEKEIRELLPKISSLETIITNLNEKNNELSSSLDGEKVKTTNFQNENNSLNQSIAEEKANNKSLGENISTQKETNKKLSEQVDQLNENVRKLNSENSTLIANNNALTEKLASHKEEIAEMQKTSHLQFETIANKILEEKAGKFTEVNKFNIDAILKPLGENIETFKKKVEETYDKESKQRFSLEEKVKELVEQTNKVSSEANNLATALKGQAKKQGNWGEMILESILQKSGLVKDREYFLQQTIKDEEGKNLRPDVLVKLPDNRIIIIDSKVSLVAYDRFSSADTPEEQSIHLTEHLKSIYAHIDDLQNKKYDNLEKSLDFTMMFIPIEPAYLISIQTDQDLWTYAYSKRILLISPTNLIACLKLMADLWKRELQSKNAMEIVRRGELLYEKFVGFVGTIEELGKQIGKTQVSYTTAIGQLNSGSGNLVTQALKLKELGLKSSKEIPTSLLPNGIEQESIIQTSSEENN